MRNKNQKRIILHFALSFCILIFTFCISDVASAATLYFSPSSGEYAVGKTFSVSVYVSSSDQAMNAASGVISFPSDKLEVTSLSKTGSIFSLWVQEPSFSNSNGTINFEGIVLNPGFTGPSGKIITITFKVKAAGQSLITFSSGSVLANDGQGTNILKSLGNAQFGLNLTETSSSQASESTTPSVVAGTPFAPQISSPTHPDPNKWYNNSNPKFVWQVPNDVTAVRILYDKYPNSQPTIVYTPPITEKQLENIKDGIYYFHIQFRNSQGWGAVSHFRFQIDTQPPEPFTIKFIDGKETENPRPTIVFDTTDSLSGVNYYKIKIGEGDFFSVAPEIVKSNPYTLPLQNPGKRNILIQAFDKAENYSVATEEFTIIPLEAPIFTEYPRELQNGQVLIIKGKTKYPEAQINFWLQHEKDDPKNYSVRSDQDGKFTFVVDEKLASGVYTVWAEVTDARGAKSNPSEKISILVGPPAFLKVGSFAVGFLVVIIPLVALIFVLLFIIWYGWHKLSSFRKKIRKETKEAEESLHQAFKALKEEIEEQVAELDGKPDLSEREKKICNNLKKALKISEKFIGKEIEDIEREINWKK
jgi:hypothetical protein